MVYGTVCWAAEAFVYLTLWNVLPPSQNYRLRIIVILGMSTTTNKQGKKTKIAPQCLCHVLFSHSHSKFRIHSLQDDKDSNTAGVLFIGPTPIQFRACVDTPVRSKDSNNTPVPSDVVVVARRVRTPRVVAFASVCIMIVWSAL